VEHVIDTWLPIFILGSIIIGLARRMFRTIGTAARTAQAASQGPVTVTPASVVRARQAPAPPPPTPPPAPPRPAAPRPVAVAAPAPSPSPFTRALSDPGQVRTAVVLAEVLGPPRALR
jgi:hypothetical protein